MSLKKAAVTAIAATLIFSGSSAVAQPVDPQVNEQTTATEISSDNTPKEDAGTSVDSGSSSFRDFFNKYRDVFLGILIALASLQGIAIIAGPIRTWLYNVTRV
ncbi:hypothetical protein ACXM2N_06020 [Corynebacterium sp. ZY180755]